MKGRGDEGGQVFEGGGAPSCSQVRLEPLGLEEPSCLHMAIQLPSLSYSQSVSLFPSLFLCQFSLCLPLSLSLSLFLSSPPSLSDLSTSLSVSVFLSVGLFSSVCLSLSLSLSCLYPTSPPDSFSPGSSCSAPRAIWGPAGACPAPPPPAVS